MRITGLIIVLLGIIGNVYAGSEAPWYPHPDKHETQESMLKMNLDFLLTSSRSAAGLEFISLPPDQQFYIYEGFANSNEYVKRIGSSSFRTFDDFSKKMLNYSRQVPNLRTVEKASLKAYINTVFFYKRMKQDMGISYPVQTFDQSLSGMQIADYKTHRSNKFHEMALKVCKGDISNLGIGFESISPSLINAGTKFFAGKSCRQAVKDDILDIVNPYINPIKIGPELPLEGTGIYLAKKLIPNRKYESSTLYRALLQSSKIPYLLNDRDQFEAFHYHLNRYSNLDIIRLMSLANHNHGLELFVLNGILDLSDDVEQAYRNVIAAYTAINHLYKIISKHDKERKVIALKKMKSKTRARPTPQRQYHHLQLPVYSTPSPEKTHFEIESLDRQYHYWGGAFMACELISKGYNSRLASFISARLGQVYEMSTNKSGEGKVKGKNNDTVLHSRGAAHGTRLCD